MGSPCGLPEKWADQPTHVKLLNGATFDCLVTQRIDHVRSTAQIIIVEVKTITSDGVGASDQRETETITVFRDRILLNHFPTTDRNTVTTIEKIVVRIRHECGDAIWQLGKLFPRTSSFDVRVAG